MRNRGQESDLIMTNRDPESERIMANRDPESDRIMAKVSKRIVITCQNQAIDLLVEYRSLTAHMDLKRAELV